MSRSPMLLTLAMTALLGSGLAGGYGQRYVRREFTIEEEEEQSVHRMMRRARARRRAMERAEITERELAAAREAAAKEAARPKSRQELRARERARLKRASMDRPDMRHGRVIPKEKSSSLERMLRKVKR